ncbi:MAG: tripartite tricarboxylate transporter TctB family protein [Thermodesulfobacteriota bacterium]
MSKSHNVANLVVIALGIFVSCYSYYSLKLGLLISPDAGFMPFLCGLALILLGIVWRIQTMIFQSPTRVNHSGAPPAVVKTAPLRASRIKLGLAFVATVAYAALFERIGFFLSTLLFMLAWQMAVERRHWLKAIIITILCAAAMYTLFKILLRVALPPNPLLS